MADAGDVPAARENADSYREQNTSIMRRLEAAQRAWGASARREDAERLFNEAQVRGGVLEPLFSSIRRSVSKRERGDCAQIGGRAPRLATNTRAKGSRRKSSEADDPDPESDDDPGPTCLAVDCREPVSARATFCSDACRKRASRSRAQLIDAAEAEAADFLTDDWRDDNERAELIDLMERNFGPGILLREGQEIAPHRRHAHAGAGR